MTTHENVSSILKQSQTVVWTVLYCTNVQALWIVLYRTDLTVPPSIFLYCTYSTVPMYRCPVYNVHYFVLYCSVLYCTTVQMLCVQCTLPCAALVCTVLYHCTVQVLCVRFWWTCAVTASPSTSSWQSSLASPCPPGRQWRHPCW